MNASRESYGSIVPGKRANKAGGPVAEPVEERDPADGNHGPDWHAPYTETEKGMKKADWTVYGEP